MLQRAFVQSHEPTYLKKESDKMVMTGVYALLGLCTLVWGVGA